MDMPDLRALRALLDLARECRALSQHGGGLFRLSSRQAIDNAGLALVTGDIAPELALPVALHLHREFDVRTAEAEHELLGLSA